MTQSFTSQVATPLPTGDASLRSSVAAMMPLASMTNSPIANVSGMSVSIDHDAASNRAGEMRKPTRRHVEAIDQEPTQKESPLDFDSLYLALSGGKNRRDATVRMVEWLAKALPGVNVRCGLGTKKLSRFFDARLGWLTSESNLQREMSAKWRDYASQTIKSQWEESEITLRLSRAGQDRLAVVCISGDGLTAGLFEELQKHESVMAAILLGQPIVAFQAWSMAKARSRYSIITASLLLMLLFLFPVPYRAACTVRVEPVGARAVSAPFEATLESVLVEPGDEVQKGQSLVELDGRPLRLELQSIEAEIHQATKQQDIAIAAGKIAEAQQAQLKCQQLRRQSDLIQRRLGQLIVTSPIDGVVVVGDLRRSIGATLEIGQVLFEVAPLDRMILEVEIPEREISLVEEGAEVKLRVDSARVGTVDAVVHQIYPSAQLRDDQSVFIAPIEVGNQDRQYRPGMRGKATVYGPIRPWAWSHLRGVFEQATWLAGF